MKRTALKRTVGLKPGDGLKPDPEKVREFQARARRNSNRRPPLPREVREVAMRRSGGRCVMCGQHEWAHGGPLQPHHVLPVQANSALTGWPELAEEPANIVMLCAGCHDAHERAMPRVPLVKLPACALRLAEGHPDRAAYLLRTYGNMPQTGA